MNVDVTFVFPRSVILTFNVYRKSHGIESKYDFTLLPTIEANSWILVSSDNNPTPGETVARTIALLKELCEIELAQRESIVEITNKQGYVIGKLSSDIYRLETKYYEERVRELTSWERYTQILNKSFFRDFGGF